MRMNAVLSNPKHPEYGQFTVPLPIPHNQYDGIMEALNAMDMGDPLARDCQMDEILGEYPILKRLEGKPVNIDELDYLAKRLDSFCYGRASDALTFSVLLRIPRLRPPSLPSNIGELGQRKNKQGAETHVFMLAGAGKFSTIID